MYLASPYCPVVRGSTDTRSPFPEYWVTLLAGFLLASRKEAGLARTGHSKAPNPRDPD
jgi:hypothetical protein